uniref:Uncharacterized protein n=1 Tax=Opuntia streptacantha TaxID=393608 RepID=A0A7C9DK14_OPUST
MKMETTVCGIHSFPLFSHFNSSISLSDPKLNIKYPLSTYRLSSSAMISYAHKQKSPPPAKPKTEENNRRRHRTGLLEPREKTQKLKLDVSPHRAGQFQL